MGCRRLALRGRLALGGGRLALGTRRFMRLRRVLRGLLPATSGRAAAALRWRAAAALRWRTAAATTSTTVAAIRARWRRLRVGRTGI
jgi:hypothetical protein